jgi:uncharacterized protein (TIGR03437 family)
MKTLAVLPILIVSVLAAGASAQPLAFGPLSSLPAQQAPLAITAADFNGDGLQDIAIANTGASTISIFLGTGGGKFSSPTTVSVSVQCKAAYLTSGKFTGAASPDLLVVCALGNFAVLPNTGGGTFGTALSTNVPGPAWVGNLLLAAVHPAIADFNGDGHLDIAIPTLNLGVGGFYVLLGNGNGTFQNSLPIPFSGVLSLSIAAGDFNGDGKPDLVTITLGVDVNGNPTLSLQFAAGNGDGTFVAPTTISVPTTVGSLILAVDVNGDGNLDLVIAGSSLLTNITALANGGMGGSGVTVLLGDGKGDFTTSFNATENTYMTGAALANVLGSGNFDLIEPLIQGNFSTGATPTGAIEIRPGHGDGTFGNPITLAFPSTTVPTDIAVADFNGDGRPDIAVAALPALGITLGSVSISSDIYGILSSLLAGLPSGEADVLLNTTVPPTNLTFTNTNAASFAAGSIASGSIVSAFGNGLAESIASAASLPLPTTLADATIAIKDSSGATTDAPLFYVSPKQINYAIPDGIVTGLATITITSGGSVFNVTQKIVPVAPGVFSSPNRFAAGFTAINVNGVVELTPLVQNGALVPVDVSGGQVFLELFGTGIRNHANPVVATIDSTNVTAAYAGAQGVYIGEDQINIQLPSSLQGSGEVALSLLVDGQTSNTVVFLIK